MGKPHTAPTVLPVRRLPPAGVFDRAETRMAKMVTDPTVLPAPPHITAKQLRHDASALLHGDPQAQQVVKSSARKWWDGVVAARK